MSEPAAKQPKYFLLKALIFPVLVVPALVVTLLVIRGNEAEQLYYQALTAAANNNFAEAARFFERAESMGHAESSYNLALLYSSGVLDSADPAALARKHLQKAALNGSLSAEYELGKQAEYSRTPDYSQAAMHYRKAALGGHIEGLMALGRMHEKGLGVNQSVLLAKEFYEKAAQSGNAEANTLLAQLYYSGDLGKVDENAALNYLHTAAEKGYPKAFTMLGYIYERRSNSTDDRRKAAQYYQQAAEANDPDGMVNYGDFLQSENRLTEALELWLRAVDKYNHAPALHRLGVYYFKRQHPDYHAACQYFEQAAKQGSAASWVNLGIMAEKGLGRKVDLAYAGECYRKAAELGHADGKKLLENLPDK